MFKSSLILFADSAPTLSRPSRCTLLSLPLGFAMESSVDDGWDRSIRRLAVRERSGLIDGGIACCSVPFPFSVRVGTFNAKAGILSTLSLLEFLCSGRSESSGVGGAAKITKNCAGTVVVRTAFNDGRCGLRIEDITASPSVLSCSPFATAKDSQLIQSMESDKLLFLGSDAMDSTNTSVCS